MDTHPLQPFLAVLADDGFSVTMRDYERIQLVLQANHIRSIAQLKDALTPLIARSATQQDTFRKRFDQFFAAEADLTTFQNIDYRKVLAELKNLAHSSIIKEESEHPFINKRFKLSWILAAGGLLSLLLGLWALWVIVQTPQIPAIDVPFIVEPPPPPPVILPSTTSNLKVEGGNLEALPIEINYLDILAISPLLWVPFTFFWLYLQHRKQTEEAARRDAANAPPTWDENKAQHFHRRLIGGLPAPRLTPKTLDELTDALGYFQDETGRRRLDARTSVHATVRRGGLPTFVYLQQRKLRRIYVLEDKLATEDRHNTVARELAEGFATRGVNVIHGYFTGVPTEFKLEDGSRLSLSALQDEPEEQTILLFSDCQALEPRNLPLLQKLSGLGQYAWLEAREPRAWDARTALVMRAGIPVYPATAEGLLRALNAFASDLTTSVSDWELAQRMRGLQPRGRATLAVYLEYLLGDALRWAQACAMLQPVTIGLADALRRKFLPHLPPERLERLLLLPNTYETVVGLKFSDEVLAVLRAGFAVRWSDTEQDEILRFIMKQISAVEPEADSLAHLAWEWTLERVNLELAPDQAVGRLHALSKTPIGAALRAELENVVLPGTREESKDAAPHAPPLIPLRVWPESAEALQQLADIAELITAPKLAVRPARLTLRQLKAGARYQRRLKIYNRGGMIKGELISDTPWLKCAPDSFTVGRAPAITQQSATNVAPPQPVLAYGAAQTAAALLNRVARWLESAKDYAARGQRFVQDSFEKFNLSFTPQAHRQQITVSVDTAGLTPGAHRGTVMIKTAAGDHIVPVSISVRHSLTEAVSFWLRRMSQAVTLQILPPTVFAGLALVILTLLLPPNWINRYVRGNQPPELTNIEASLQESENADDTAAPQAPQSEANNSQLLARIQAINFRAQATDPEGTTINFRWQVNNQVFESNAISIPPPGEDIKVTLSLSDSDGGHAVYRRDFEIKSESIEVVATPTPIGMPTPTPSVTLTPTPLVTTTPTPVSVNPTPTPTAPRISLIKSLTLKPSVEVTRGVQLCWQLSSEANYLTVSCDSRLAPNGGGLSSNYEQLSVTDSKERNNCQMYIVPESPITNTYICSIEVSDLGPQAQEEIKHQSKSVSLKVEPNPESPCQPEDKSFTYPHSARRYNFRAALRVRQLCGSQGVGGAVTLSVQLLNDPRETSSTSTAKANSRPNHAQQSSLAFMTLSYNWVVRESEFKEFERLLQFGADEKAMAVALDDLVPLLESAFKDNPKLSGFELTRLFQSGAYADRTQAIWRKLLSPYFEL